MQELQTGLNTHLSWVGSPATFNIDSITTTVMAELIIDYGRPLIGAYEATADDNHAAVVYGYTSNSGSTVFHVHGGWASASLANNLISVSSDLFFSFGYIVDCRDTGEHDITETFTGNNYHSGNYHYYQKKYDCEFCPHVTYEYVQRICNGNCIMINGTEHNHAE